MRVMKRRGRGKSQEAGKDQSLREKSIAVPLHTVQTCERGGPLKGGALAKGTCLDGDEQSAVEVTLGGASNTTMFPSLISAYRCIQWGLLQGSSAGQIPTEGPFECLSWPHTAGAYRRRWHWRPVAEIKTGGAEF